MLLLIRPGFSGREALPHVPRAPSTEVRYERAVVQPLVSWALRFLAEWALGNAIDYGLSRTEIAERIGEAAHHALGLSSDRTVSSRDRSVLEGAGRTLQRMEAILKDNGRSDAQARRAIATHREELLSLRAEMADVVGRLQRLERDQGRNYLLLIDHQARITRIEGFLVDHEGRLTNVEGDLLDLDARQRIQEETNQDQSVTLRLLERRVVATERWQDERDYERAMARRGPPVLVGLHGGFGTDGATGGPEVGIDAVLQVDPVIGLGAAAEYQGLARSTSGTGMTIWDVVSVSGGPVVSLSPPDADFGATFGVRAGIASVTASEIEDGDFFSRGETVSSATGVNGIVALDASVEARAGSVRPYVGVSGSTMISRLLPPSDTEDPGPAAAFQLVLGLRFDLTPRAPLYE